MCVVWFCYTNSSWKIRTFSFVEEVKSFGGFLTHCYMNQTTVASLAFQVHIFHILYFFPSFSLHLKLCQNTTLQLCFFPLTITKIYTANSIIFCHIFQFQLYTVFIFFFHANNHFLSFIWHINEKTVTLFRNWQLQPCNYSITVELPTCHWGTRTSL